MHILFLTDNFPPEVNAPASRTHEHCREWVKAGHRVTVLTCAPNFPHGRIYPGYRNKAWQREAIDGIEVVRVWSYVAANTGFTRRVADYLSYMFSAVLGGPFIRRVDLVVGTSPQFFTAIAAYVVSLCHRVPFVFELRDIWPESIRAVEAGRDAIWMRWLEKLELFLYRRARLVVAVTWSFRDNLIRRGIAAQKIRVVTNGVDLTRFTPSRRDERLAAELGLSGRFVAGYIGTHGLAHGLGTILAAAELARSVPGGERFRFLLLGDGAQKSALVDEARTRGLDNIVFVDSVAKEQVPRYWALLDVALIHLRKADLFASVIPSKLFESMGMGIPVLLGVKGEAEEIVRRTAIGLPFEPEDPVALLEALLACARDDSVRARWRANALAAAAEYSRRALAAAMLRELVAAVEAPRKRAVS
jgi:glycosyltransferase involved in cell wall biosynthesis